LTVAEAHALGARIAAGIKEHYPGTDVTFHFEPIDLERASNNSASTDPKQG
ncbi:MAG: hypothetical protein LBT62_08220, partial [Deltaproteobacteria bacterium]|nr:hypothetical protein [Deltaproteobacteria bacterium]